MEYRYQLEEKKPCLTKSKSRADQDFSWTIIALSNSEEMLKKHLNENRRIVDFGEADQLKPSEFEILKSYTGENTHYEIDESMENFIWGDK